jgi:hypothetical protein
VRAVVVAICVAALALTLGCAGRGPVCRVGAETFRPPARILGSGGGLGGVLDMGSIGIFLEDADGSELWVALGRTRDADVDDPRPREDASSEPRPLYVGFVKPGDRGAHIVPVGGAEEKGVICLLRSSLDHPVFGTRHADQVTRAEIVLEVLEQRNEQSN